MQNGSAAKTSYDPRLKVILQPVEIETDRVFVIPPEIPIGKDGSRLFNVQWVNYTDKPAWLWMPNGDQFFEAPDEHDFSSPFLIPPEPVPEEERLTFTVSKSPQEASSQYQVYCDSINGYAEGHSPPIVRCP
jgi:hypothetical protein